MKNLYPRGLFAALLLACSSLGILQAQSPSDAIMMKKGQLCVATFYARESWDEYWEGALKRDNGNIGTFTRQSVMPMFSIGIHEKINILGALPWMKTAASAGQMEGVQGWQDWGLWVKATALQKQLGKGELHVLATLGAGSPSHKYLCDYMPFSLGLGCKEVSLRGIAQYGLEKSLFVRAQAGYHLRGESTIERDYYYTTHPVYSDKVDMPNALTYGFTLGSWFFDRSFKIEASYDGLQTLGGFDIRRQDAGFPSNKMIFTRLGGNVQYYLPFVKGLGLHATAGYVLSGRNVGQSLSYSGGISYFFNVWH